LPYSFLAKARIQGNLASHLTFEDMAKKPLILVSNDDGITAPGIHTLVKVMRKIGDVVVVAPDGPQSGMGHAITIGDTLRLDRSLIFPELEAYECSGTPADCVKIAKHHVLKDRKPDLVVSGINHGSNSSISVLYSGTMSAAIEAAIEGLPAIGFSLCDYGHDIDFSHTEKYVEMITRQALEFGIPHGLALNVNFPKKSDKAIAGVRVCRQARAKWEEEFDERKDPMGRSYYWLTGNFVNFDKGADTDEAALAQNYVSVVPCQFDMTANYAIVQLNNEWNLNPEAKPAKGSKTMESGHEEG
jgi:5'-nucleotidase